MDNYYAVERKQRPAYEINGVRDSAAGRARIGEFLLRDDVTKITASNLFGTEWTLLVLMPIELAEAAKAMLKAAEVKYHSPTYFGNSAIRPKYDNAQDEIDGRTCFAYRHYIEQKKRQEIREARRRKRIMDERRTRIGDMKD